MRSQYNHPRSIPVENLNKQKGCHSGARPPEGITLIFYMRWAVDAIESLCVALRIVKRRPIISKPFVRILSLTLQNDTTGRMAKAFATGRRGRRPLQIIVRLSLYGKMTEIYCLGGSNSCKQLYPRPTIPPRRSPSVNFCRGRRPRRPETITFGQFP